MNKCKVCGKETMNVHYCSMKCRDIDRYNKSHEIRKCKTCDKEFETYKTSEQKFCSVQCSTKNEEVNIKKFEHMKKTNMERHGVEFYTNPQKVHETFIKKYGMHYSKTDEFKDKFKKTMNEKHGVDYPQQSTEIKKKSSDTVNEKYGGFTFASPINNEKVKKTMVDRYGVTNARNIPGIEEKIKKTNLERYGVEYGLQSEEILTKTINTNREKYGVDNVSQVKEIKDKVKISNDIYIFNNIFKKFENSDTVKILFSKEEYLEKGGAPAQQRFLCKKCNKEFLGYIRNARCYDCYPNTNTSQMEKEIFYYLQELLLNTEILSMTKRVIKPYELDIYIPEYKLAVEFNGLFWHSSEMNIDKNSHVNKTNMCENLGIHLIHIFEDDWATKKEIIKQKLRYELRITTKEINISDCNIIEIDSKIKNEFLNRYHPKSEDKSDIKFGVYYENELISCMTFNYKKRAMHKKEITEEYEISRFCSLYYINELESTLINKFIKHYKPEKISITLDRCWEYSNNNKYTDMGFIKTIINKPTYWYIPQENKIKTHRFHFNKTNLKDLLEIYDEQLTERENMQLNGYEHIWDCGTIKYELKVK